MPTLRHVTILLLAALAAGCVNVQSPETVEFSIGGGGGGKEDPDRRRDRDSGKNGGWKDTAAEVAGTVIGDGVGGCLFFACDVLTPPNREVELAGRVHHLLGKKDVAGMTVEFRRLSDGKRLGSARTGPKGWAKLPWTPPGLGNYEFSARVVDSRTRDQRELLDLPTALLLVSVRKPSERFVVVDLDHTLVDSGFLRVVIWDGGKPMKDSTKVMQKIRRHYGVIYLTHRPEDLTRKSRRWLEEQGYPVAPLLLSTFRQAVGDAAKFKSARLREVRRDFPNLAAGIGDKLTDVKAYRDNGMKTIWIPHYRHKPKNMRKAADEIRSADDRDVIVVSDWRQIDRAVFGDYTCSPRSFSDRLYRQADRYEDKDDD
jgi:hypothetical protein